MTPLPDSHEMGHDYTGAPKHWPRWWRLVLRHPIREARWWWRYGR